jgi:hypothetical protein
VPNIFNHYGNKIQRDSTLINMAVTTTITTKTSMAEDVKKKSELSYIAGRNVKW